MQKRNLKPTTGQPPTLSPWQKWFIFSPITVVIGLLAISSFSGALYDWDLDHEIYFAREFLQGRPFWLTEYNDKLPAQQYIYGIAATFRDPVLAFRLISLLSVSAAATALYRLLPGILSSHGYSHTTSRAIAVSAVAFQFLSTLLLPGSFNQSNPLASSLAIIAGLAGVRLLRKAYFLERIALLVLAGTAAAMAISLRPYYLFPLGVSAIWLYLSSDHKRSRAERIALPIQLITFTLVIGVFANIAPYWVIGETQVFLDGVVFLFQPSGSGMSPTQWLVWVLGLSSIAALWWAAMIGAVSLRLVWGLATRKLQVTGLEFLLGTNVLVLFLAMALWHMHIHYVTMFGWYFSILLAMWCAPTLAREWGPKSIRRPWPLILSPTAALLWSPTISLLTWYLLMSPIAPMHIDRYQGIAAGDPPVDTIQHPDEGLVQLISMRFRNTTELGSFLAPESMYVHWALGEPRHGFPHAAHTRHILLGLWDGVSGNHSFRSPSSLSEYCSELESSPVEWVVLPDGSELNSCFSSPAHWIGEEVEKDGKNHIFWSRQNLAGSRQV